MSHNLLTKAQTQNLESVAVTIILIILITLTIVYLYDVQTQTDENIQPEQLRKEAKTKAQQALHINALKCSRFIRPTPTCYELHRIQATAALPNQLEQSYRNQFGFATITIHIKDHPNTYTLYNNTRPNASTSRYDMPLVVHNPTSETYHLSTLQVEIYG